MIYLILFDFSMSGGRRDDKRISWSLAEQSFIMILVGVEFGERELRALRAVCLTAVLGGTLMSAGCGSYLLPASGPNSIVVRSGGTWNGPPYGLVKLTPQVINILQEFGPRTLSTTFGDRRPPPEITFGIGDIISCKHFRGGRRWPFHTSGSERAAGQLCHAAQSAG